MNEEIKEQQLPAPDEAPLTMCPHCGIEYNILEVDPEKYYESVVEPVPGTNEVARHRICGKLVRFVDYSSD